MASYFSDACLSSNASVVLSTILLRRSIPAINRGASATLGSPSLLGVVIGGF